MASNASNSPQSSSSSRTKVFSPNEVAWMFVKEFYTFFNKDPASLYKFYNNSSTIVHGEEGETTDYAQGQAQIQSKYGEKNLEQCKVCITNVDSIASVNGGVFLQVIGEMSNRREPSRKFVQSFFLAEQEKGYYVHNDIFRYLKEDLESDAEEEPEVPSTVRRNVEDSVKSTAIPEPSSNESIGESNEAERPETPVDASEVAEPAAVEAPEPEKTAQEPAAVEPVENDSEDQKETEPEAKAAPVTKAEPAPSAPQAAPKSANPAAPRASAPAQAKPAPAATPAPPKSWARMVGNTVAEPKPAAVKPASAVQPQQPAQPAQPPSSAPAATTNRPRSNEPNASVYVKNLNDSVTADMLKTAFSVFGEVLNCAINNQTKTAAFVDFATVDGAQKAAKQCDVTLSNGTVVHAEEKRPRINRYHNGHHHANGHHNGYHNNSDGHNRNYANRAPPHSGGADGPRGRGPRGRGRGDFNKGPRPAHHSSQEKIGGK